MNLIVARKFETSFAYEIYRRIPSLGERTMVLMDVYWQASLAGVGSLHGAAHASRRNGNNGALISPAVVAFFSSPRSDHASPDPWERRRRYMVLILIVGANKPDSDTGKP